MNQEITTPAQAFTTPSLGTAEQINLLHAWALGHAKECRDKGDVAVESAWECGKLLNTEKKKLHHGQWLPWLTNNCPSLPERTAQSYMACATKYATLADLKRARLEKTYVAAGILPEPEHKTAEPSVPKPDVGVLFIQRACQHFNQPGHDLLKLDQPSRQVWKERLRPLHELYERL